MAPDRCYRHQRKGMWTQERDETLSMNPHEAGELAVNEEPNRRFAIRFMLDALPWILLHDDHIPR